MNKLVTLRGMAVAALFGAMASAAGAQTTLRIGLAEDPDVLDPTLARTFVGRIAFASLCDKLFDIDAKLNIVPQLATGYEIAEDKKTITIKLRPNVKFHDGEPMNAEAVKYSLTRHLELKGSFRRSEINVISGIEVIDPLTVKLSLSVPFAPLMAQFTDRAGMIVSPKAAEAAGDKFGTAPVCAGPFKFVERVAQDRIVVERFADYWSKDAIKIDRIVFQPIPDSTVRLANIQAGSLDLIERVSATDLDTIRKNPKLKLSIQDEIGYQGMTINLANGERSKGVLGQNPKVREALEAAIDRNVINQVAFNGEFLPGNQWVSPVHPYFQGKYPVPGRDLKKAQALLKEAGVKLPVTFTLMFPNNPDQRQVAEIIQSMAQEAGFDIKLEAAEFASSLQRANKGDFEAYLIGWSGRTDPDGNVYSFESCKGGQNDGKHCNPGLDKLLDAARAASSAEERKKLYEEATGIVLSARSRIYLYHRKWFVAYTNRLQGFSQVPDGLIRVQGLSLN